LRLWFLRQLRLLRLIQQFLLRQSLRCLWLQLNRFQ
jgi:hypothetical protein